MSPPRMKWLVFTTPAGHVSTWDMPAADIPAAIAARKADGCRIVAVCDGTAAAVAAKHDAEGLCGGCRNGARRKRGTGAHRCQRCQRRLISKQLRATTDALDMVQAAQAIHASVVSTARAEVARGARGEQR